MLASDSTANAPAPQGNIREIRLGLVCYGGVSLAIYMHGMTKELQKLVIASRALEDDPEHNTLPANTTEHVYWQVLKDAQQRSLDRALPRVVIDVVAGTSAGGINGVILCKALAHNLSQDALRDLWFEKGDIKQLLGGSLIKELGHVGGFLADLFHKEPAAPLDGNAMLGWLFDALETMDRAPSSYRPKDGRNSLMPAGHELQLFVTTTDYNGYRQYMTIADPPTVTERRNRHILNFRYLPEEQADQFGPEHNGVLAFTSRATSSFPGAFPPIRLADARNLPKDVATEFFRAYQLSGADPGETYFIDGGVLNNYPFRPAIEAIVKLRAESEVSRYLLYLQPDPGGEVGNPQGEAPHFFGTVWAGLSSVASSQPILEELVAARGFNERVRRIDELVAHTRQDIEDIFRELRIPLDQQVGQKEAPELRQLRDRLDAEAEQRAGYLYDPYLQIRAHSIVEQFAAGICQVCDYRDEQSNVAFLIRLIVDAWARRRRLIGDDVDTGERRNLLNLFDLGYTRRRFAFVLQGINQLYHPKDGQQAPSREQLDSAKTALYDRIGELRTLINASSKDLGEALVQPLRDQFPLNLTDPVAKGQDLQKFADLFVDQHRAMMDTVFDGLGALLRDSKDRIHAKIYENFRTLTATWTPAQRQGVMLRYLGFPFWDAMIYPATSLSEAGELRPLQIVRMSPNDSTLLGLNSAAAKLKGVANAHFGAFLKREWRENDYLWGRLDAAERLVGLVLKDTGAGPVQAKDVKPAFAAILAEEGAALKNVQPLIKELRTKIGALV
jgi:patatin-related protein